MIDIYEGPEGLVLEADLPGAREASDALGPDRERVPGTWTVRLDRTEDGQADEPEPGAA